MRRLLVGTMLVLGMMPLDATAQARRTRSTAPVVRAWPAGWTGRVDPQEEKQEKSLADVQLDSAASGLQLTAGPAVAFWNTEHRADGAYSVTATFSQLADPFAPASYGLFMGGSDLKGKTPNYLYCAIFANGNFSIKHRLGGELHSLVERRAHPAIRKGDANGRSTNQLAWQVASDSVRCLINGAVAAGFPRDLLIGSGKLESTDGVYGVHADRGVTLGISPLTLTRP